MHEYNVKVTSSSKIQSLEGTCILYNHCDAKRFCFFGGKLLDWGEVGHVCGWSGSPVIRAYINTAKVIRIHHFNQIVLQLKFILVHKCIYKMKIIL